MQGVVLLENHQPILFYVSFRWLGFYLVNKELPGGAVVASEFQTIIHASILT